MMIDPSRQAGSILVVPASDDAVLAHCAAIVEGSDDAIVSKTLRGIVTSWNPGATRLFGWTAEEIVGQSISRIIPADLKQEEDAILARLALGERIEHFETVRLTRSGQRIEISVTVSPIRDRSGTIIGASKVARDIGDRRRAEQLQTLLIEELNHRVKNTLAMVQALATQSLRTADGPERFVAGFSGRLQALARSHDLLIGSRLRGSSLQEILRTQVPLDSVSERRVSCAGPAVHLAPDLAIQVGLVLHELVTNARRHGALSVPQGRVAVQWRVEAGKLLLDWRESEGPRPDPKPRRGFGTWLIERALEAHGGGASLRREADGMACRIVLPLSDGLDLVPRSRAPLDGAPATAAGPDLAGKRVLIVEDEPLIAMELEFELAAAGCAVVGPAADVGAAARLIEARDIDVALLDANLAGQSVEVLARRLRAKGVPFAFATGYGRDALPVEFRDAPLLAKPFGRAELLPLLCRLLRS